MYMLYISNPSKCIISAKIEPLKFRTYLLKVSFFRPFQLMKSKKTSNDQELIQSDPISCPQNQKGNN